MRRKRIAAVFISVLTVLAALLVSNANIASAGESSTASVGGSNVALAGEPGPFKIQNRYSGFCLRDDGPYVVAKRCSATDGLQRWIFWNGGWVKNQYTGRCMRAGSTRVWTETCNAGNQRQLWTQTGAIIKLTNAYTCLHVVLGTAEDVRVNVCDQIWGPDTRYWSVTYW